MNIIHWCRTYPAFTALWLLVAVVFIGLRVDTTDRFYYWGDEHAVVFVMDEIIQSGDWDPDWYRVEDKIHRSAHFLAEEKRTDIPHEHEYSFATYILLSAALIKPLRLAGLETPTNTLMHHFALFWDSLSLLLLIAIACRFRKPYLALVTAVVYSLFPLAVQSSHYARPDAFLIAISTAMLWLALAWHQQPTVRWLLTNSVLIALATGAKASQLLMAVLPALSMTSPLLRLDVRHHWRAWLQVGSNSFLVVGMAILLLAALFASVGMSHLDFINTVRSIQLAYYAPSPPVLLETYTYTTQLLNILDYFYAALGAPLLVAILLGATTLWQQPEKKAALVLTVPTLFFIAYFASIPAFFDRSFCPSVSSLSLLAAFGIIGATHSISRLCPASVTTFALALLCCARPAVINYHLQTDHLRDRYNEDRLAFQRTLKTRFPGFWIKHIDQGDLFSRTLPARPAKTPRIYVAEDFNDWNSRVYAQQLRANGFVQVAEFEGDFHDFPTSSLLTIHEAARFRYFIRADELPAPAAPTLRPTP